MSLKDSLPTQRKGSEKSKGKGSRSKTGRDNH